LVKGWHCFPPFLEKLRFFAVFSETHATEDYSKMKPFRQEFSPFFTKKFFIFMQDTKKAALFFFLKKPVQQLKFIH